MADPVTAAVAYIGGTLGSEVATAAIGAFLFENAAAIATGTLIGGAPAFGGAQKHRVCCNKDAQSSNVAERFT